MKAKRGAKRSGLTFFGPIAVVAITIGVLLCSFIELGGLILNDESWNIETIENVLGRPLPADAHDIEFDGRTGRGAYLDLTFTASHESVNAFVSQFCEGPLYQAYDPFNAIDMSLNTKEKPQEAYIIKMGIESYYSYSQNTSENLFGMRCLARSSNGQGQMEFLVDKTSLDVALLKIQALFTCQKCNIQ